jgi:hypothetical protein
VAARADPVGTVIALPRFVPAPVSQIDELAALITAKGDLRRGTNLAPKEVVSGRGGFPALVSFEPHW